MIARFATFAVAALLLAGCTTPTTRIDIRNDRGPAVAALDYRDIQEAVSELAQSLFRTGRLNRADGKLNVLTVGNVENDTMQHLDTDILTNYLVEEMVNSGQVLVSSAISHGASQRDEMIGAVRSVRGDPEFNQSTVAAQGQLVDANLSLKGKIVQRELRMDGGDKQVEYYFSMMLTDTHTGLRLWQKQHLIGKRTDARTPTW